MFVVLAAQDVVVLRWNSDTEQFDHLNTIDPDEAERYKLGVLRFEFDATLGAYPVTDSTLLNSWMALTSHITPRVLFQLEPLGKRMQSASKPLSAEEEQLLRGAASTSSSSPQSSELAGRQQAKTTEDAPSAVSSTAAYYTPIPKHFPTTELTSSLGTLDAAARTKLHLDKTLLLEWLSNRYFEGDLYFILGELQFSFLSFLLVQSFEAFDHWKELVQLLCSCEDGLVKCPAFFSKFIICFEAQLNEVPTDFFVDLLSGQNFLTFTLKGFYELLDDQSLESELRLSAKRLFKFIEQRFGLSFALQNMGTDDGYLDECEPVVVDLGEYS